MNEHELSNVFLNDIQRIIDDADANLQKMHIQILEWDSENIRKRIKIKEE